MHHALLTIANRRGLQRNCNCGVYVIIYDCLSRELPYAMALEKKTIPHPRRCFPDRLPRNSYRATSFTGKYRLQFVEHVSDSFAIRVVGDTLRLVKTDV